MWQLRSRFPDGGSGFAKTGEEAATTSLLIRSASPYKLALEVTVGVLAA